MIHTAVQRARTQEAQLPDRHAGDAQASPARPEPAPPLIGQKIAHHPVAARGHARSGAEVPLHGEVEVAIRVPHGVADLKAEQIGGQAVAHGDVEAERVGLRPVLLRDAAETVVGRRLLTGGQEQT